MEVCLILLILTRRREDMRYFMNWCRCSEINFTAIRNVFIGNHLSNMTRPILHCLSQATGRFRRQWHLCFLICRSTKRKPVKINVFVATCHYEFVAASCSHVMIYFFIFLDFFLPWLDFKVHSNCMHTCPICKGHRVLQDILYTVCQG
jgi:hypothetical protein